jgi:enoyl-[acyl-carrier protein] reductase III
MPQPTNCCAKCFPAWSRKSKRITRRAQSNPDKQRKTDMMVRNPGRRLTTPEDVPSAIAALMVAKTRWMTGSVIRVDSGQDIVA